ncbi:MAG: hypothetical protein ACPGLV_16170, partial [Bacteroidia bacterium]
LERRQSKTRFSKLDSTQLDIIIRTEGLIDKMVDTLKASKNLIYDPDYLGHFFVLKMEPYSLFVKYDFKLDAIFNYCHSLSEENFIINSREEFQGLILRDTPLITITTLSLWEIQMLELFKSQNP